MCVCFCACVRVVMLTAAVPAQTAAKVCNTRKNMQAHDISGIVEIAFWIFKFKAVDSENRERNQLEVVESPIWGSVIKCG